jgi:hypothetical protein
VIGNLGLVGVPPFAALFPSEHPLFSIVNDVPPTGTQSTVPSSVKKEEDGWSWHSICKLPL